MLQVIGVPVHLLATDPAFVLDIGALLPLIVFQHTCGAVEPAHHCAGPVRRYDVPGQEPFRP